MGDDRKAEYEMAPTSDPENPEPPAEKADLGSRDEDGSQQWAGLSKEELLRVADTPAWNWTRIILLILFWIAWVVMLIVAIVLVVKAPGCPDVEWYEKSPVYQVYLRSFRDGNNDGYGDLKGLTKNVQKIKEQFGAETILLSPMFKQANDTTNFGHEPVNFMDIDPTIGTLDEFDKLVEETQVNGMHLIMEFDPNHSSDQHEWFIKSALAEDENDQYWDFYIWADTPNDWTNYKGENAWTLNENRGQYYYHFYEPSQPDLNLRSEKVKSEIKDIMSFWLGSKKVDGFVVANVDHLLESPVVEAGRKKRQVAASETPELADTTEVPEMTTMMTDPEEGAGGQGGAGGEGGAPEGGNTPEDGVSTGTYPQYGILGGDEAGQLPKDLEELLNDLYQVIEGNSYLGKFRVFIPQHSGSLAQNAMYAREDWRGFPRSIGFIEGLDESVTGYYFSSPMKALNGSKQGNCWSVGYSGISRLASRAGNNARALLMLMFALPGTPMPYYGEELGLKDLNGENGQLGPYPWSAGPNGGFSENSTTNPWMAVAENIDKVNLEAQMEDADSDYAYFKKLAELRQEPSLLAGEFKQEMFNDNLFAFTRKFPEWVGYLTVVNFGGEREESQSIMDGAVNGTVVLSASGEMIGKEVQLDKLTIMENDALLIRL